MRQRIKGKFIKRKLKVFSNAYKDIIDFYNLIRLNYVVELKLGKDYLDEKGNNLAEILENYFVNEGYDIIVERYMEGENSYLIIDCEDEKENMWNMVGFIYRLLVKFNIEHEIIW
ncbi:hypothetical protein A500_05876 [Clostridium sartagoforme AAU1]|uniref:Uncharacterized protein n=1 Tax=Clostridium sartagoforme AAU1 TaxID=1202534 RepID=R9CDQ3_9CLOT|nr:hypothetical protein [Clostridium sartagoforme]EOR27165.1 hypothetical protein A500_05876 [Clostridium sartagoforme AAU1]